jgi:hypothetical protein
MFDLVNLWANLIAESDYAMFQAAKNCIEFYYVFHLQDSVGQQSFDNQPVSNLFRRELSRGAHGGAPIGQAADYNSSSGFYCESSFRWAVTQFL